MFRNKERQEVFGLRKYKGVGLASAVICMTFLAPSVMAEETTNVHASNTDNTAVDGESTVPNILKPNSTTPPPMTHLTTVLTLFECQRLVRSPTTN